MVPYMYMFNKDNYADIICPAVFWSNVTLIMFNWMLINSFLFTQLFFEVNWLIDYLNTEVHVKVIVCQINHTFS